MRPWGLSPKRPDLVVKDVKKNTVKLIRRGRSAYAVIFAFLEDVASLLFGSTPRVEVPHYAVGIDAVEAVA